MIELKNDHNNFIIIIIIIIIIVQQTIQPSVKAVSLWVFFVCTNLRRIIFLTMILNIMP